MKSLSKREQVLLLVLGITLVGYLYYALLLTPVQKKIDDAKLNIDKYSQEINNAKIMGQLVEKQKSELEAIKTKFDEARAILPQMEMNPQIVYNIKKFFEGSDVEVTSITIGQPEDSAELSQEEQNNTGKQNNNEGSQNGSNSSNTANPPKSGGSSGDSDKIYAVPVTITLSADNYEQVMKFTSMFENDKRFAEITDLTITANRPAPQPTVSAAPVSQPAPPKVEKKPEDDKIEVVVVGEGEDYKEIPVEDQTVQEDSQDYSQSLPAAAPEQSNTSIEPSKPKIEVTITAKYYYISSNTSTVEKPAYSFKNGVYGKKDLFK